jgi:hypothetical protein
MGVCHSNSTATMPLKAHEIHDFHTLQSAKSQHRHEACCLEGRRGDEYGAIVGAEAPVSLSTTSLSNSSKPAWWEVSTKLQFVATDISELKQACMVRSQHQIQFIVTDISCSGPAGNWGTLLEHFIGTVTQYSCPLPWSYTILKYVGQSLDSYHYYRLEM